MKFLVFMIKMLKYRYLILSLIWDKNHDQKNSLKTFE